METVVRDKVPAAAPDPAKHCLAAGLIARHCGVSAAYLASLGKEFSDAFGDGDASAADWRADRAGIDCARDAGDDDALLACCAGRGY
jgi:hypothetical protein